MPRPPSRHAPAVLALLAVTVIVSACAPFLSFRWPVEPVGTPLPFPGPSASPNPVAVFDVVGETFRIELVGTDNLVHAQGLLAGGTDASIPSGLIVRGDPGVNAPWSWHIDPSTLEWADMTTEVCDGTPSQIEDGSFTFERFCPWAARVVAIEHVDN